MIRVITLTIAVVVMMICALKAQPVSKPSASIPAVGPRGPVGPGVPLSDAERRQFAKRITVDGSTAAAVQAACERAVKESARVVFLPAGEYVFEQTVRVPGGITVLGEGSRTVVQTQNRNTRLFSVDGDYTRFTRMKLQGANTNRSTDNNTYGISCSGKKNCRIDHCELLGFNFATQFGSEATAQIDHCHIHHNLRDGLGYGVAIYSGAYVLITDSELSQNRHSLASNGALDWSSPKRLGKYLHKPGVRKTHWEFIHNRVDSNDLSRYELTAVDTHPGMDGTFVVEGNLFENLRHGVGIRDGSGLIRGNVFRSLRTRTTFRPLVAISIGYGKHNNIPVDGCMPRDIEVEDNVFLTEGAKYEKCRLGKAENIVIDGQLVPKTKVDRPAPPPLLLLVRMDAEGKLGIGERKRISRPRPKGEIMGKVVDESGKPVDGANVFVGSKYTMTDGEGRFELKDIPQGRQPAAITKSGFDMALLTVALNPEPLTINPRLTRDLTAPIFLDVRTLNLTHTAATIAWETNEPTTSEVDYGPTAGGVDRETRSQGEELTTAHRMQLTDLRPATIYRCLVKATDGSGNSAMSDELTFRTAPISDPTPPKYWGRYAGAGRSLWGRTRQEAHSGELSAFLKGVVSEGGLVNFALVMGDSNGYSGANAYPADAGAVYEYSFWAKGDFKEMLLVLMTWTTEAAPKSARQFTRLTKFSPTPEWKPYQGRFTMPAEAKEFVLMFRASLQVSGREELGVLYVDDVQVRTGQTEVIKNGGAEN